MSKKTGFDRYFEERMKDEEFAKSFLGAKKLIEEHLGKKFESVEDFLNELEEKQEDK